MTTEATTVINVHALTRKFGDHTALDNVSLQIPAGKVCGIVGENGAGKTTLIKHILGLYRAQQGSVSVFGLDPVSEPEAVLARIGYLSEQPDIPAWMSVAQFMQYLQAFYRDWNEPLAQQLIADYNIDPRKKIGDLSKGHKARVGLCAAQAHRPDLLLLDEPSSGLDPIVRTEILTSIIRTVADEGRTVVLSSHLLEEVERVCDHLVIINRGKLLLSEPMDTILSRHHLCSVRAQDDEQEQQWHELPGVFKTEKRHDEWLLYCYAEQDQLIPLLAHFNADILEHRPLTLNEIFIARSLQLTPTSRAEQ